MFGGFFGGRPAEKPPEASRRMVASTATTNDEVDRYLSKVELSQVEPQCRKGLTKEEIKQSRKALLTVFKTYIIEQRHQTQQPLNSTEQVRLLEKLRKRLEKELESRVTVSRLNGSARQQQLQRMARQSQGLIDSAMEPVEKDVEGVIDDVVNAKNEEEDGDGRCSAGRSTDDVLRVAQPTYANDVVPEPIARSLSSQEASTINDVGKLEGILRSARVSTSIQCICSSFSEGVACGRPAAHVTNESRTNQHICWRCMCLEIREDRPFIAVLEQSQQITANQRLPSASASRNIDDLLSRDQTKAAAHLRDLLRRALVSETETCAQSLYTPDGQVCGRPAALACDALACDALACDTLADHGEQGAATCWACTRMKALYE